MSLSPQSSPRANAPICPGLICAAPTALGILYHPYPALTRWANFCRASGPQIGVEQFRVDIAVRTLNAQRRRRVKKLAQGVSPGKAYKKEASPSGAAQNLRVLRA